MKIKYLGALAGLLAFGAMTAQADEVWTSELGEIVYESEIDRYAVLSFPAGETRGYAFIDGLAGNYEDRNRIFTGYWTEEAAVDADYGCPMEMTDQMGRTANIWGRLMVVFHDQAFPSGFSAVRGDCFDEPDSMLMAYPKTYEDMPDAE